MNYKFKKSLLVYTIIILILVVFFSFYIIKTLIDYENNQTGEFLKSTIANLSDEKLLSYLSSASLDASYLNTYKSLIKSDDIKYTLDSDSLTFIASLNGRDMFQIKTKVVKVVTKLAIFSYQIREVTEVTPILQRGLIYYDIIIPSNYTIYLDGNKYEKNASSSTEYPDLDFMYYDYLMPYLNTYEINNLDSEKNIEVKDFQGNSIDLEVNGYIYKSSVNYYENLNQEDAKKYISDIPDVLEIAENWSKFLTNDLSGSSYGFTNIISNYVIKGTSMYEMAYNWAHNVDITFVSKHTLENPPFSNEFVKNFTIYGNEAFSCEVYLEKNMLVGLSKTKQTDIMHDYLYFIKYNGEWKLMNIKAVDKDE